MLDINSIKNELENYNEPSSLFNFLFQNLLDFLRPDQIAFFIFEENNLLCFRNKNLERETFHLREPEYLPLLKEFFQNCTSGEKTLPVKNAKNGLWEPFAIRYSHLRAYPIRRGEEIIGGVLIPSSQKTFPETLQQLPLILHEVSATLTGKAIYEREINLLKKSMQGRFAFGSLIGKSPVMQEVYKMVEDIAGSDITVLIQGETGTGKELLAKTIHQKSQRRNGPFIRAFCSAYTSTLMQSELFGHEKGAFTGAFKKKKGRFELAKDGTLFLDEIGDINEATQVLLLRFLETKEFERVGGEETLKSNGRIITATNRDLQEMVRKGKFREDLFFRLNMVTITMPPLREKIDDIPLLSRHLLHQFCLQSGKMVTGLSPETMKILLQYHWPGNVRELKGVLERGYHLTKHQQIEVRHLPPHLLTGIEHHGKKHQTDAQHKPEKEIILDTLAECRGNKKAAAEMLGISRPTLYQRLKRYGLPH